MIKSMEELLNSANAIIGENDNDDALGFLGDLKDTLTANNDSASRIATLEQEKADLDKSWRQKYRERFFSGGGEDNDPEPEPEPSALKTKYEELFS